MHTFCGVINFEKKTNPILELDIKSKDKWNEWKYKNVYIKYNEKLNYKLNFLNNNIYFDNNTGVLIITEANIYNKEYLSEILKLNTNCNNCGIFLNSYLKWGDKFVNKIDGDFIYLIYNTHTRELLYGRDRLGTKSLYIHNNNNSFYFSNSYILITSIGAIQKNLNINYIINYLHGNELGATETIYKEITSIKPSYYYKVNSVESYEYSYWNPNILAQLKETNISNIVEEFSELLFLAIRKRIDIFGNIGAELSGGLDSSLIISVLAITLNNKSITTFSHVLSNEIKKTNYPLKDELKYINKVNEFCGISKSEYILSEDSSFLKAIENSVEILGTPPYQFFSVFSDKLYEKVQRNNINILFSGFGGDEGVSSSNRMYIDSLIKSLRYLQLLKVVLIKNKLKPKEALFNLYYLLNRSLNPFKVKQFSVNPFVNAEYNIDKCFLHNKLYIKKSVNSIQYIQNLGLSQRLEYCYTTSKHYGFEYRYPLLDIPLLEYFFSIPDRLKYIQIDDRFFFRQSCKKVLPESIHGRMYKSGSTIPSVLARFDTELKEIYNYIMDNSSLIGNFIDIEEIHIFLNNMRITNIDLLKFNALRRIIALISFLNKSQKKKNIYICKKHMKQPLAEFNIESYKCMINFSGK